MASDEHKRLANIIKETHESLRQRSKIIGPIKAWEEHLQDTKRLQEYAESMRQLAAIWENNTEREELLAQSRVKWVIDYCLEYFFTTCIYLEKRQREERLLDSWPDYGKDLCQYHEEVPEKICLLDVGSCFNPFGNTETNIFDVTAIDLCPASKDVLKGDFLKIEIVNEDKWRDKKQHDEVEYLLQNSFECVVFSLLLEYIPSSSQRLMCCQKAYELLKPEGILIIITPDSQHVGKNASLMKTWRYALASIGFTRIKFEKLPHITCMVFRKAIDARIAERWAKLHKEEYMNVAIEIPQDTKS